MTDARQSDIHVAERCGRFSSDPTAACMPWTDWAAEKERADGYKAALERIAALAGWERSDAWFRGEAEQIARDALAPGCVGAPDVIDADTIVARPPQRKPPARDLMAALKASLAPSEAEQAAAEAAGPEPDFPDPEVVAAQPQPRETGEGPDLMRALKDSLTDAAAKHDAARHTAEGE